MYQGQGVMLENTSIIYYVNNKWQTTESVFAAALTLLYLVSPRYYFTTVARLQKPFLKQELSLNIGVRVRDHCSHNRAACSMCSQLYPAYHCILKLCVWGGGVGGGGNYCIL